MEVIQVGRGLRKYFDHRLHRLAIINFNVVPSVQSGTIAAPTYAKASVGRPFPRGRFNNYYKYYLSGDLGLIATLDTEYK